MSNDNNQDYQQAFKRAKERVDEIKGFYIHFGIYVCVIGFLFAIDFLTGPGWWFYFPALGWGVGLAIHGFVTFSPFNTQEWEDRKVRELMEREGYKAKRETAAPPTEDDYFEQQS